MATVEGRAVPEGVVEDAARYRALLDGSMDAIYVSREDGRILEANRSFLELFGYARDQLSAVTAEQLYADPEERRRFRARVEAAGAVHDYEAQLRRSDGAVRTCLITASTRRAGDGSLEYQGIIRDVTDRRREQAELQRATEALRRSNAELEQFAYVASHDLQEPLRKIRAFGDRLNVVAAGRLDERGADYLGRMTAAAERMQTLIENLLLYSRVSSRGAEFRSVPLDRVLEEVLDDLEPVIAAADAEVRVGPLPVLEADPSQMRQLFQNLVANAIKFGSPGRRPLVEVESRYLDGGGAPIDPRERWDCAAVQIQVRDNGIGFEPEYAERIFELFQRLHGRSSYEGTGIGLGVCRRIVMRHGGSIRAEGVPGRGSIFTVVLPLTQERAHDSA